MKANTNVLLSAYHFNCMLMGPGTAEWRSTTFKMLYCGDMHIKVRHQINEVDEIFQIPSVELEIIKNQLKEIVRKPIDVHHNVEDGAMWEIKIFDEDGKIAYNSTSGYIDGIEKLEELSRTLYGLVPKYNKPDIEKTEKAIPVFHAKEITGDGDQLIEMATYELLENKDRLLAFLKGFDPEFHSCSGCVNDYVFGGKVSKVKNYRYTYRKFYWDEEMIYHFEKYNIPLNREFVDLALLRIDVPDIVYIIKDGRIGTVVDKSNQDKYIVECCNMDQPEFSEDRYSLYYDLNRLDLRLLKVFHKRIWGRELA